MAPFLDDIVKRPWGFYQVLTGYRKATVKELVFNGLASTSHQRHQHRSEIWTVVEGRVIGTIDGETVSFGIGNTFTIHPGQWHQLGGTEGTTVIEIWVGDTLSEDDIERKDDAGSHS